MTYLSKIKKPYPLIAVALAIAIFWLAWLVYSPVARGSTVKTEFTIAKGDGSSKVASLLAEQHLIRSRLVFLAYAVATGQEKKFQAGRYELSPSMNIPQLVHLFSSGLAESDDVVVTIPEGLNTFEIDRLLTNGGLIKLGQFSQTVRAENLEGYLFPDTYRFDKKATVPDIIKKMRDNFGEKVGEKITYQQLIIASLLEKEVQNPKDMALVAGIINQRLKLGMLLQIDATVTYGACLEKEQKLKEYKFCDVAEIGVANFLSQDSPYNTYLRKGLPAGPVGNPGLVAIQAALHPASSPYLYYLTSKVDGQTIFSKTVAEHERNRAKYLK